MAVTLTINSTSYSYPEDGESDWGEIATDAMVALAASALYKDASVELTADWDIGNYYIQASRFISDIATGTSPLTVSSTTVCANLNADKVDGKDSSDILLLDGTNTMSGSLEMGNNDINGCTNLVFTSGDIDGVGDIAMEGDINTTRAGGGTLSGFSAIYSGLTAMAVQLANPGNHKMEISDTPDIQFLISATTELTIDANGATLKSGASVNEFSIDGTLGDNSDDAVPTEKAVKTYVDGSVGAGCVKTDGSTPLTADWDAGSYKITAEQFESDIVTGTAPIIVASTTVVSNLNADQVDGKDSTDLVLVDGSQGLSGDWDAGSHKITAEQLESDIATGTAPLIVASTTVVSNLNADQVDGKDSTDLVLVDGSQTLTSDWDIGDGRKIQTDEIQARDGAGLKLTEDGGAGIFVEDGGEVGIGTTTPLATCHVELADAVGAAAPNAALDVLVVENNTTCAINLISPTNALSAILFSDDTRADGYIGYQHGATPDMTFVAGGSECAKISGSGLEIKNNGVTIAEFSTDGTLGGDSDTAVPTEKAVKTYVDNNAGISDIVEDTTPQLGGDLDTNDKNIHVKLPDSDGEYSAVCMTTQTVDTNSVGVFSLLEMAADGNYDEADADAEATCDGDLALALESGTGSKKVMHIGFAQEDDWAWTPGQPLYVSTTVGTMTQTAPSGSGDIVRYVGTAMTADMIYFNPSGDYYEVQ